MDMYENNNISASLVCDTVTRCCPDYEVTKCIVVPEQGSLLTDTTPCYFPGIKEHYHEFSNSEFVRKGTLNSYPEKSLNVKYIIVIDEQKKSTLVFFGKLKVTNNGPDSTVSVLVKLITKDNQGNEVILGKTLIPFNDNSIGEGSTVNLPICGSIDDPGNIKFTKVTISASVTLKRNDGTEDNLVVVKEACVKNECKKTDKLILEDKDNFGNSFFLKSFEKKDKKYDSKCDDGDNGCEKYDDYPDCDGSFTVPGFISFTRKYDFSDLSMVDGNIINKVKLYRNEKNPCGKKSESCNRYRKDYVENLTLIDQDESIIVVNPILPDYCVDVNSRCRDTFCLNSVLRNLPMESIPDIDQQLNKNNKINKNDYQQCTPCNIDPFYSNRLLYKINLEKTKGVCDLDFILDIGGQSPAPLYNKDFEVLIEAKNSNGDILGSISFDLKDYNVSMARRISDMLPGINESGDLFITISWKQCDVSIFEGTVICEDDSPITTAVCSVSYLVNIEDRQLWGQLINPGNIDLIVDPEVQPTITLEDNKGNIIDDPSLALLIAEAIANTQSTGLPLNLKNPNDSNSLHYLSKVFFSAVYIPSSPVQFETTIKNISWLTNDENLPNNENTIQMSTAFSVLRPMNFTKKNNKQKMQ
jgi:hypothetical protein